MNEYRVVVPSTQRATMCADTVRMLPECTVVVPQGEGERYAYALRDSPHAEVHEAPRPLRSRVEARMYVMGTFREPALAMVDDDLLGLKCLVGAQHRTYRDPKVTQAVLEHGVAVTLDLGLSLYGWNRDPRPFFKGNQPVSFNNTRFGKAYVIRGTRVHFDPRMAAWEDTDLRMTALLLDRIVFFDERWHFDFGPSGGNPGGSQTFRDAEVVDRMIAQLLSKWGGRDARVKTERQQDGRELRTQVAFRVQRRNDLAVVG